MSVHTTPQALPMRAGVDALGSAHYLCCTKQLSTPHAVQHLVRVHGLSEPDATAQIEALKHACMAQRAATAQRARGAPHHLCPHDGPQPYTCRQHGQQYCEGCYFSHLQTMHHVPPQQLLASLDEYTERLQERFRAD